MAESLWDWSLRVYRGDVPGILIDLQDSHGQNVPLLLWAVWCTGEGIHPDVLQAIAVARAWDDVITPLRTARRQLKTMGHETLRTAVKAAELQAEKALMEVLERTVRASPVPAFLTAADAVMAVANAWAPGCPPEKLARLTEALSEG